MAISGRLIKLLTEIELHQKFNLNMYNVYILLCIILYNMFKQFKLIATCQY